jgi:uncharacterized membrane protein YccC
VLVFGTGVFGLGAVCAVLRLERSACRFAGITLAIVLLIPHVKPVWMTAAHRFLEVAAGIAVAVAFTTLWSESPEGN